MREISEILKAVEEIPPFPQVVLKAFSLLKDPEVSASELVDVIQYDPIITTRILKVCNSASFGFAGEIDSLHKALVLLGNNQMMQILVTIGSVDFLIDRWEGYGLETGELWEHSVSCALMSQVLIKQLDVSEDHGLFTAALLHDVGKIVLSQYALSEYPKIKELITRRGYSSIEAEKEVLGFDHAELGSLLAQKWQFPMHIARVIEAHHNPVDPKKDSMTLCLTHLANLLCLQMGIGVGDRGLASRAAPRLIEALGWDERTLEVCLLSFWIELDQLKDFLNISKGFKEPGISP
jgi:putative nucleotidyltransferase with HDIG domain